MQIETRIQDTDLAEALRDYIERRLRFALGRFGSLVGRISVRICDLNGPRGGNDKSCRIRADVVPRGHAEVREVDADLYTAVDRATQRIVRSFAREVERVREGRSGRTSVRTSSMETSHAAGGRETSR